MRTLFRKTGDEFILEKILDILQKKVLKLMKKNNYLRRINATLTYENKEFKKIVSKEDVKKIEEKVSSVGRYAQIIDKPIESLVNTVLSARSLNCLRHYFYGVRKMERGTATLRMLDGVSFKKSLRESNWGEGTKQELRAVMTECGLTLND